MWIRIRLDIAWRDLIAGACYCIQPAPRNELERMVCDSWNEHDPPLVTLSVRSAFDLLLRALRLPNGSEVLFSALTVPNMVEIVRHHGLTAVPVDTNASGELCLHSLKRSIRPESRILVVAHLFGNRTDLDQVAEVCVRNKVLLVEDCAQCFERTGDSGHPHSDAVMYSFGPIKTATALGGGVVHVRANDLREKMQEILSQDPVQPRMRFALRIGRFGFLKACSGKITYSVLLAVARILDREVDQMVNSLARGFSSSRLFEQLRQQPSSPLLRLLLRRWQSYPFERIQRRKDLGRLLDSKMHYSREAGHSYWVYPIGVNDRTATRDRLRAHGFDATWLSRMIIVPPVDEVRIPSQTQLWWSRVLFLPWYPELTERAVGLMAEQLEVAPDNS